MPPRAFCSRWRCTDAKYGTIYDFLAFSARIGKTHEPVCIQAFRAEIAFQALDERIIRRLSGPGEVALHTVRIGPYVTVARAELETLIEISRLAVMIRPACLCPCGAATDDRHNMPKACMSCRVTEPPVTVGRRSIFDPPYPLLRQSGSISSREPIADTNHAA